MGKTVFIFLLLALPFVLQAKIYAVLVGISEYATQANNLTYCHRDAMEMYEILKGYTAPNQIILLTDKNAKLDNIVYQTRQLFQKAQPEDVVIFFFSGHGDKNVFCAHDKNLHFSALQRIFKQTKAKRKMIFADACHAGTLRQSSSQAATGTTGVGSNVMLFLSSRSAQTSRQRLDLRNGLFTYFLLAALRGGADFNRDKYITAKELFDFVNPKVKENSGGKQVPVMWGKFDEQMIILNLNTNRY